MARALYALDGRSWSGNELASNTTRYLVPLWFGSAGSSTETRCSRKFPESGTFAHLWTNVLTNTLDAAVTMRVRVAAANGNGVISIPASTTGYFEDTSGSDAITASQLISLAINRPTSTGAITFSGWGGEFTGGTNTVIGLGSYGIYETADSTTRYLPLAWDPTGAGSADAVDTVQTQFDVAGTLGSFQFYHRSNTRTTATTVGVDVDGSPSAISVSVAGGAAEGTYEDLSNTASIASGSKACLYVTLGSGGGNFRSYIIALFFWNSTGTTPIVGHSDNSRDTYVASYRALSGCERGIAYAATDAAAQEFWPSGGTLSNPRTYVSANTLAGTGAYGRITLMKNGVATDMVIDCGTTTGWKSYTGNITVAAGDALSWRVDTPNGTSGAFTPRALTVLQAEGVGGQSYTCVPSGGMTLAGAATPVRGRVTVPSGGAIAAGTGAIARGCLQPVSGGAELAGTAIPLRGRVLSPGGGSVLGGSVVPIRGVMPVPSGGAILGGASVLLYGRVQSVSGGLVTGGAATWLRGRVLIPAGGLLTGGSAAIEMSGTQSYTLVPSGGLDLGGLASIVRGQILFPAGGLALGGSLVPLRGFLLTPSGGLTTGGGAAGWVLGRVLVPSGGGSFGGTAVIIRGQIMPVAGGMVLSGTATIIAGWPVWLSGTLTRFGFTRYLGGTVTGDAPRGMVTGETPGGTLTKVD